MRRPEFSDFVPAAAILTFATGIAISGLETPQRVGNPSQPPISDLAKPANSEQEMEIYEKFTLTDFFREVDKQRMNPDILLGRKFEVTLDRDITVRRAYIQERLSSQEGEEIFQFIVHGPSVRAGYPGDNLIANVPQGLLGDGSTKWPSDPKEDRTFFKSSVIFFSGELIRLDLQASTEVSTEAGRAAFPLLRVVGVRPPPPANARGRELDLNLL